MFGYSIDLINLLLEDGYTMEEIEEMEKQDHYNSQLDLCWDMEDE